MFDDYLLKVRIEGLHEVEQPFQIFLSGTFKPCLFFLELLCFVPSLWMVGASIVCSSDFRRMRGLFVTEADPAPGGNVFNGYSPHQ